MSFNQGPERIRAERRDHGRSDHPGHVHGPSIVREHDAGPGQEAQQLGKARLPDQARRPSPGRAAQELLGLPAISRQTRQHHGKTRADERFHASPEEAVPRVPAGIVGPGRHHGVRRPGRRRLGPEAVPQGAGQADACLRDRRAQPGPELPVVHGAIAHCGQDLEAAGRPRCRTPGIAEEHPPGAKEPQARRVPQPGLAVDQQHRGAQPGQLTAHAKVLQDIAIESKRPPGHRVALDGTVLEEEPHQVREGGGDHGEGPEARTERAQEREREEEIPDPRVVEKDEERTEIPWRENDVQAAPHTAGFMEVRKPGLDLDRAAWIAEGLGRDPASGGLWSATQASGLESFSIPRSFSFGPPRMKAWRCLAQRLVRERGRVRTVGAGQPGVRKLVAVSLDLYRALSSTFAIAAMVFQPRVVTGTPKRRSNSPR